MLKADIAIIGMACRFPGARDYTAFWENLKNGKNSIREITSDRWDITQYYSGDIHEPNKSISKWCGLLDNIDKFDYRFFNISPREAANIDPQQRLLLEETWHCIEDAGLTLEALRKKTTSVYAGFMAMDYHQEAVAPEVLTESYACLGNYGALLANRISYYFGLNGQSIAIDAACASSLVAIHHARRSLLSGESDYALVGAASLNFHPWKYVSFSKSRMLSPDGQCKTFDQNANGYVPGDGVGVLLLQRIADALQEGNHIYGIIKGTAVNHGGRTDSITAPRVEAQRDVIVAAYEDAGLSPEAVSYIEAHGTGTSLGDPIEIEALTQAFRKYTHQKRFCKIGAVKTNIGHLEAAAGMAGIVKVLLMMRHRKIPGTLNISSVNPLINFEDSPFEVALDLNEWKSHGEGQSLRAGVSSFGFGGVNSHVVVESFGQKERQGNPKQKEAKQEYFFVLSAKSVNSLNGIVEKWKSFSEGELCSEYELSDICATLMTGRSHLAYRLGFPVKSKDELKKIMQTSSALSTGAPVGDWFMRIGSGDRSQTPTKTGGFLDQSLKRIEKNFTAVPSSKRAAKQGRKSPPPSKSFLEDYAFLSALVDAGFAPKIVTYEGSGFWTALVISGIIGLEDALDILADRKKPNEIRLNRPRITFYDPVTGAKFKRYNFTEEYLRSLLNTYETGSFDDTCDYYVKKARTLKAVQFTFKRYLDEWDTILQQSGFNLTQMLAGDGLLSMSGSRPEGKKLLLLIVIISSLVKLNQKWNLSEDRRPADKGFCELLDLVVDDVLPKDLLVELFSDSPDYLKIAQALNERQHFLNESKPYEYLRMQCQDLWEIHEIQDWIQKAAMVKSAFPAEESMGYLEFGNIAEPAPQGRSVFVNMSKDNDTEHIFEEALFHLWLNGVDVRWGNLYPEGSYKRVALPGYDFEKKSLWLSRSAYLQSDDSVAASFRNKKTFAEPQVDCKPTKINTQCLADDLLPVVPSTIQPNGDQRHHFTVKISKEDPIIHDHVITGKNLIPGAHMIELGLEAIQKALKRPIKQLNNVIMKNPGIIEAITDVEVEVHTRENKFFLKIDNQHLCEGEYV